MAHTLPRVGREHHERILEVVAAIPALADDLLAGPPAAPLDELDALVEFLAGSLLPHMEATEQAVYPELERLFQNRHSMTPMRREHREVARLVGTLSPLVAELRATALTLGRALALRRVLFQLYALLEVHIAEEDAYLRILDRGTDDEAAEVVAAAMAHPVA